MDVLRDYIEHEKALIAQSVRDVDEGKLASDEKLR